MSAFDVAVIGAGPGGYPAAIRAAQLGATVALIERDQLGGTCLNWGCISTKALIAGAERRRQMAEADAVGLEPHTADVDYARLAERKDRIVKDLRDAIVKLLDVNGVAVFNGHGELIGRGRVAVRGEGRETVIDAANVIVATGSEPVMPPELPKHDRVVDSRTFLARRQLPRTMLIVGGGIIGCEFACMAAQFGVQVTVIELLEDILAFVDRDVRGALRRYMEKTLGIRILTGKRLEHVRADDAVVAGVVNGTELRADLLLAALGRRPVTRGLGLENAGLETDQQGYIPVNEFLQTDAPTIFAIGDVIGGPQLAHAATSNGLIAAENACGPARQKAETVVPACIFTAPEIAAVGLTEQQARQQGIAFKKGKFLFAHLPKAIAAGDTVGFVKWLADAETERLIGAHAVGPHATELIAQAALALRAQYTARDVARTVHAHPTFAEAWQEAAAALRGESIYQAPAAKK